MAEELVRAVVRAFHGDDCVVVAELLLRNMYYTPEDEICTRLRLPSRAVRRVLSELRAARIVASETTNVAAASASQQQLQFQQQQQTSQKQRVSWYVDFPRALNAVRYRLHALLSAPSDDDAAGGSSASNSDSDAFECPNGDCGARYSAVAATAGVDMATGQLRCTRCGTPLRELSAAATRKQQQQQRASDDETQRAREALAAQLRPLAELVRRALALPLPEVSHMTPDEERAALEAAALAERQQQQQMALAGRGRGAGEAAEMVVDVDKAAVQGGALSATAAGTVRKPKAAVPWLQSQSQPQQPQQPQHQQPTPQQPALQQPAAAAAVALDLPAAAEHVEEDTNTAARTLVSVGGKMMPLESVTEADQQRMSDAEYLKYSEALQTQFGEL